MNASIYRILLCASVVAMSCVCACDGKKAQRSCDEGSARYAACLDRAWTYEQCAIMSREAGRHLTMDECQEIAHQRCCQ